MRRERVRRIQAPPRHVPLFGGRRQSRRRRAAGLLRPGEPLPAGALLHAAGAASRGADRTARAVDARHRGDRRAAQWRRWSLLDGCCLPQDAAAPASHQVPHALPRHQPIHVVRVRGTEPARSAAPRGPRRARAAQPLWRRHDAHAHPRGRPPRGDGGGKRLQWQRRCDAGGPWHSGGDANDAYAADGRVHARRRRRRRPGQCSPRRRRWFAALGGGPGRWLAVHTQPAAPGRQSPLVRPVTHARRAAPPCRRARERRHARHRGRQPAAAGRRRQCGRAARPRPTRTRPRPERQRRARAPLVAPVLIGARRRARCARYAAAVGHRCACARRRRAQC